jgi:hypothetical protein
MYARVIDRKVNLLLEDKLPQLRLIKVIHAHTVPLPADHLQVAVRKLQVDGQAPCIILRCVVAGENSCPIHIVADTGHVVFDITEHDPELLLACLEHGWGHRVFLTVKISTVTTRGNMRQVLDLL